MPFWLLTNAMSFWLLTNAMSVLTYISSDSYICSETEGHYLRIFVKVQELVPFWLSADEYSAAMIWQTTFQLPYVIRNTFLSENVILISQAKWNIIPFSYYSNIFVLEEKGVWKMWGTMTHSSSESSNGQQLIYFPLLHCLKKNWNVQAYKITNVKEHSKVESDVC